MNPATNIPTHRPKKATATATAAEPIDVRRIRLVHAAGGADVCAVVSEFRTADQVLDRWIGRGRGSPARRQFSFEIVFNDGYTLTGCYEFWRGARRRPSLQRCVRSLFCALAAPSAGTAAVDLSRYAIDAS